MSVIQVIVDCGKKKMCTVSVCMSPLYQTESDDENAVDLFNLAIVAMNWVAFIRCLDVDLFSTK